MLFSTYKKHDILSLATILDTDIITLENRGYDGEAVTALREPVLTTYLVQRIREKYKKKLSESGHRRITTFYAGRDAH